MANDKYSPRPNTSSLRFVDGRQPRARSFGEAVATLPPVDAVRMLAEVGAWASTYTTTILCLSTPNLPIEIRLCTSSRVRAKNTGSPCRWLPQPFLRSAFRDGAFTANDPQVPCVLCTKTSAQWIWERNSERRSSCVGRA